MNLDTDSLERLVPDEVAAGDATGDESLRLCIERYTFAAHHAQPGRALDAACGSGYGTRMLLDHAGDRVREVVGLDIFQPAVDYATERYGNERVRFVCSDAVIFDDENGFDTIVSIETLEHLPDPESFVASMSRLLRPGGVFVGSVPTTPSVDANPHHLHDFNARTFRQLLEPHGLREIDSLLQVQRFSPFAVVGRTEARMKQVRENLPSYYATHPSSLVRRIWSTVRYGFVNHYLTIAWQRS